MTIKRMDHVSVVDDDLPSAIAFFTTLGMALEGETPVEGLWVDRVNRLESVQVDIVMMRTPDGPRTMGAVARGMLKTPSPSRVKRNRRGKSV